MASLVKFVMNLAFASLALALLVIAELLSLVAPSQRLRIAYP